jgi:hypothetical protein
MIYIELPNNDVILNKKEYTMEYLKYPRTKHLLMSESRTSDDKTHSDYDFLVCKDLVVTVKMDGENCTMYNDHIHARSISSANHPSRDWVKQFHAGIKNDIEPGWRICGENLYAKHSIEYNDLESYFYGFSVWQGTQCLGWDETMEWFKLLDINPVRCITEIPMELTFNEDAVISVLEDCKQWCKANNHEGFVVRPRNGFAYKDFSDMVGKYVRANHVQTESHWMHSEIVPNNLKG